MATTIKQTESEPSSYAVVSNSGWSTAAAALSQAMIWQRIEAYIAHRWRARAVEWIVEGPGEWVPPLAPATISAVKIWNGTGWDDCTADASPLGGYWLTGVGPYQFTASVGYSGSVDDTVIEAFRRLAEYMAAKPGKPGASRESVSAGSISTDWNRSASWMAQAMQNSGAGDLLRGYRRV